MPTINPERERRHSTAMVYLMMHPNCQQASFDIRAMHLPKPFLIQNPDR